MRVELAPHEVHIWQFRLDQAVDESILSADEIARANRLIIPSARTRFIAGRVHLRQTLSLYTQPLHFVYGPQGKPALENAPINFNLAHSNDHAMVAVALFPVGIDLEQIRPLDGLESIVHTAFTARERAELERISEDRKISAFFRLWVCKEAVMKALGEGFKLAQQIEITNFDAYSPLVKGQYQGWFLHVLPAPKGYNAVLAVQTPKTVLRFPNAGSFS